MSIIEQLQSAAKLAAKHPRILNADANEKLRAALEKQLATTLDVLHAAERESDPLYMQLTQALGKAESTDRITKAWIKNEIKGYGVKVKKGAQIHEVLAAAVFDAGDAQAMLKELDKSIEAVMQEEFRTMLAMDEDEVLDVLKKKYQGAKLEKLCEVVGIQPVYTKTDTLSPAKTKAAVLAHLEKLRERL